MIDTLVLNLQNYTIRKGHKLTIDPPVILPEGNVNTNFFYVEGEKAKKAYHNAEKFNVSILQGAYGPNAFVQTSLPRYHDKNNLNVNPIGSQEAKEVLQHLESDLNDIGIEAKINQSKLSRADIFKNAKTKYPFETYSPVFSLLQAKRMKKIEYEGKRGIEGYAFKNDRHEIICYDKNKETFKKAAKNNLVLDTNQFSENLLRDEYRMKGNEKIQAMTNMTYACDLVNGYSDLEAVYNTVMKSNFFMYEQSDIEIVNLKHLENILAALKKKWPRSYMQRFQTLAAMNGYSKFGSVDRIALACENIAGNRMAGKRFRDRMTAMSLMYAEIEQASEGVTTHLITDLYSELKTLLLAT